MQGRQSTVPQRHIYHKASTVTPSLCDQKIHVLLLLLEAALLKLLTRAGSTALCRSTTCCNLPPHSLLSTLSTSCGAGAAAVQGLRCQDLPNLRDVILSARHQDPSRGVQAGLLHDLHRADKSSVMMHKYLSSHCSSLQDFCQTIPWSCPCMHFICMLS